MQISAFMHLFNEDQDVALITMTGFNYATFNELLTIFSPIFSTMHTSCLVMFPTSVSYHTITIKRGEKQVIDPTVTLSFVLVWTRTRGTYASSNIWDCNMFAHLDSCITGG
jgi:hypothetical protein